MNESRSPKGRKRASTHETVDEISLCIRSREGGGGGGSRWRWSGVNRRKAKEDSMAAPTKPLAHFARLMQAPFHSHWVNGSVPCSTAWTRSQPMKQTSTATFPLACSRNTLRCHAVLLLHISYPLAASCSVITASLDTACCEQRALIDFNGCTGLFHPK